MIGMKGAGGARPCALCVNVWNNNVPHRLAQAQRDYPGVAVSHTEADGTRLVPATHDSVINVARQLRAAAADTSVGCKGRLAELQTHLGWTHDLELVQRLKCIRPTDTICYDWQHVLFVNGVVQKHFGLLVTYAKRNRFPFAYPTFRTLIQQWTWPALLNNKELHDVFCPKRVASCIEAKTWKATASEALSCCPVSTLLRSNLSSYTRSRLALCM